VHWEKSWENVSIFGRKLEKKNAHFEKKIHFWEENTTKIQKFSNDFSQCVTSGISEKAVVRIYKYRVAVATTPGSLTFEITSTNLTEL